MLRKEQRGEAQDAELKTCHLKENEKEKIVMCSYVALSQHKEQSTSHILILFFWTLSRRQRSIMKQLIQIVRDRTRTERNDFPEKL